MKLKKGLNNMTVFDELNEELNLGLDLDPKEPTDEELAEIELELEDDPFTISEEEYEESFGSMPDLDKGLFGAKHREKLSTIRKVYNS